MGDSNGDWGGLATDEQRAKWDEYDLIPDPGISHPLDSFLRRKNLDHAALVRIGGRMSGPTVVAFAFEGGIKYRDVVRDQRWASPGARFPRLKIVPGRERDACIVCEGETDAARLTMLYDADVAIMPAGAKAWKPTYTEQVEHYERLFVGLDSDEAGHAGYRKIREAVPHAVRWTPPEDANDWCSLPPDAAVPPLPTEVEAPAKILVPLGELLTIQPPDVTSWLDGAVLPVGGTMVIHATFKSFKTWAALDLACSLAQGRPWATFDSVEEPAKVAYLNFEIPWAYYQERVRRFHVHAAEPSLLEANYFGYQPLTRPRLVAGNEKSEAHMMDVLREGGIQIVVIDPIRRTLGFANPNAEDEVRRLLYFVERLNDEGITVVMVHHDNKESDKHGGGDPAGMTGSGAWAGDVDSIVSISRPQGTDRDGTKRNARFLLRNAPSPSPKGFEIADDGTPVVWHHETWVERPEGGIEAYG